MLIVDDNAITLETMIVTNMKLESDKAYNGEEACQKVREKMLENEMKPC